MVDMSKERTENWKWVPGDTYSKKYQVSNQGRIRSFCRGANGRILRGSISTTGYIIVGLHGHAGEVTYSLLHRVILLTFCGEPSPEQPYGLHNNGDKLDNRLENLRWGDAKMNAMDRLQHGSCPIGEASPTSRISDEAIATIRQLYKDVGGAISQPTIAKEFGVGDSYISAVVRNKYRVQAGGPDCSNVPSWKEQAAKGKTYDKETAVAIVRKYKNRVSQLELPPTKPEAVLVEGEQWAEIPHYEGMYAASDHGNILSFRRNKAGHRLSIRPDVSGRIRVTLRKQGETKSFSVSRLVLLSFVGEPPSGYEACHNNGVCDDNRLVNLRWDSKENNAKDKILHGTSPCGERNGASVLTETEVRSIRDLHVTGNYTHKDLADQFNVSSTQIAGVLSGKSWTQVGGAVGVKIPRWNDAKLTSADARTIREMYITGQYTQTALADMFGVSSPVTQGILRNKRYVDAGGPDCSTYAVRDPQPITHDDALAIRAAYSTNRDNTRSVLAVQYGVHSETIGSVVQSKRSWAYLGDPVRRPPAISLEAAQQILNQCAKGINTQTEIAAERGLSLAAVSRIVNRKGRFSVLKEPVEKIPKRRTDQKLTDEMARQIRKLFSAGKYKQGELATKYSVDRSVISLLLRGKIYKDAGGPDCSQINKRPQYDISHETAVAIREDYVASRFNTPNTLATKYGISRSMILKIAQARGCWSYFGSKVHQQAACTPKCDLETALAIRKQYSETETTQTALAAQYNLNAATISNVVNGRGAYSELA